MARSNVVWLRRVALSFAIAAALGLLVGRGLVVRDVQVVGAEAGDERMIADAAGIKAGDRLLLLDWQAAERGISALGRYRLEAGETTLTGRATLHVAERASAAMLSCGNGMAVVDGDMHLIELRQDAPDRDVLFISGMEVGLNGLGERVSGDAAQLEACRAVLAAAEESGAGGFISEVNVADAANISLVAGTGTRVLLGNTDRLRDKLSLARAAVRDIERRGEGGGVLDVIGAAHADYRPAGLAMQAEPVSTDL